MDVIKTEAASPKGEALPKDEALSNEDLKQEPEEMKEGGGDIKTENGISDDQEDSCDIPTEEKAVMEPAEVPPKAQSENSETSQRAIQQLQSDPSFAMICSFFNKFGVFLGIKPQHFNKMERLFTSFHGTGIVDRELIDLHLTLLRKLKFNGARADMWEKFLVKYCAITPSLETEQLHIERFGYVHAPVATKLMVLKSLCESQFDFNVKFKESLSNSTKASELRLLPVGIDREGLAYWYQQDAELSVRVYCEEEYDHSGGSWNLIAKSKDELDALIERLKATSTATVKTDATEKVNGATGGIALGEKSASVADLNLCCKRGTFVDTFQDESSIKIVKKDATPQKGKKKPTVNEEEQYDEEKKERVQETREDSDAQDIPSEVMDFVDRRILPRRSARNVAITHLKEMSTPSRKRDNKGKDDSKKKVRPKVDNLVLSTAQTDTPQESEGEESDESRDSDSVDFMEDEESEPEGDTSDDEFKPLSEIKKRGTGRIRRRKAGDTRKKRTKNRLLDADAMESSEDCDSGEEQVKKERKIATIETKCRKCDKSSNPEVLLLCDMCDEAWHTWCLHPILWFVPDDDWFCPKCQHAMLLDKLQAIEAALGEQLKRKATEDKKKEAAAKQLKREMEYIGVSLNNIIPTMEVKGNISESSEESDVDDGERKSKRKANRKLGVRHPTRPIVPIAVGRSRRHVAKVDYKFGAYDELMQEAMESIDEASTKPKVTTDPCRPQGGAGLGKDMANIINAEEKRKSSVDNSSNAEEKPPERKVGKPAKSHRKLNDLNVDEMTESEESAEYEASENESEPSEVASDATDEYVPSDEGRRRSGRRNQSEDDFVVSGSESEYEPSKKKSKKSKSKAKKKKGKRSKRRGRRVSSGDDSTSEEEEESNMDSEYSSGSRTGKRPKTKPRWAPRESSSENDSDDVRRSQTGRPLRKAVANAKKVKSEENEDESEQEIAKEKEQRPIGARRRKISSDEGDFEPDEDEEEEEVEEESGENEEDQTEKEENSMPGTSSKKRAEMKSKKNGGETGLLKEEKSPENPEKVGISPEKSSEKNKMEQTTLGKENEKMSTQSLESTGDEASTKSNVKQEIETKISSEHNETQPQNLTDAQPPMASVPVSYPVASSSQSVLDDEDNIFSIQSTSLSQPLGAVPTVTPGIGPTVTSGIVPTLTPGSVPTVNNKNPSMVIEQMARLAHPSPYPIPPQHPGALLYPPRGGMPQPPHIQMPGNGGNHPYGGYQTTPPSTGGKMPQYMGAPPMYGVGPAGYMKPPGVPLSYGHPPAPEDWPNPYAPPTHNISSAPMMMPTTQPGAPLQAMPAGNPPVSDADTLGNALASAMDY